MPLDGPDCTSPVPTAGDRPIQLAAVHARRLRAIWRSAGWPCQDMVEVELLAAGLLARHCASSGHETLRVTDSGVQLLAQTLQRNRRLHDAHEALVRRVADDMLRAGRLTWCGLSLRAKPTVDGPWVMAMPDVYSIRNSTVEAYLAPIVHEIKVNRADLLSDLRKPTKRDAYLQISSECWYVLAEGIAQPEEIPAEFGVLIASRGAVDALPRLEVARAAPRRPAAMGMATWMALARATPLPAWHLGDDQQPLGGCDH